MNWTASRLSNSGQAKLHGTSFGSKLDALLAILAAVSAVTLAWLAFSTQAMASDLSYGLVAHYPFNGDATDATTFDRDGVLHGATLAIDRSGAPNAAFYFDGASFIDFPQIPQLGAPSTSFTVSLWFRAEGKGPIFGDYEGTATGGDQIYSANIQVNDDQNLSSLPNFVDVSSRNYPSLGLDHTAYIGSAPVIGTGWHHVAYRMDGTGGCAVFFDGVLAASLPYNSSLNYAQSPHWKAGRILFAGQFGYFTGYIDDIRIYNRALSHGEVQELFALESVKQSYKAVSRLARTAAIASGAFGPVFSLDAGRMAIRQAQGWGSVHLFDLSNPLTPIYASTINSPDPVFDAPAFGISLNLRGDSCFLGSTNTWLTAPHDGRVYRYDVGTLSVPSLAYRIAESPHAAGYFGGEVKRSGDILLATQNNNTSWGSKAGIFIYRIEADNTATRIYEQVRSTSDYSICGAAVSGNYCAVQFLQGDTLPRELWVYRIARTGGIASGTNGFASVTLPPSLIYPMNYTQGGGYYPITLDGRLLAVANYGEEASADDNSISIYRIDDDGANFAVMPIATLSPPAVRSNRFGRRLLLAGGKLFVSDPDVARAGTTAKGVVYIYTISLSGSMALNQTLYSQTAGSNELFGEFLADNPSGTPNELLAVGALLDGTNANSDHDVQLFGLPEMEVVSGTASLSGTGETVRYGALNLGDTGAATFTVRNVGLVNLAGLSASISGTAGMGAEDFHVESLSAITIPPNGNLDIPVSFTPTANGSRTAELRITSDDPDESQFVVFLSGTGVSPEIVVEQPQGTGLNDGANTTSFGNAPTTGTSPSIVYTIRNTGLGELRNLALSVSGSNTGDFTTAALGATTVASGSSTSLSVTFKPSEGPSGTRVAALHIASNDSDENPFDIGLQGQAYSTTADFDGDGITDWGEFKLAPLGFDWQVDNDALVSTLFDAANDIGLYTKSQLQAIRIDTPLLERDATTGLFHFTISMRKSTDLQSFAPLPVTAPQITITGEGKIEIELSAPENAAFFRLEAE